MLRDEEYFPEQLTEEDHPFVGSLILRDHPNHDKPPTAACLMPRDGEVGYPEWYHVTSLKRQLNQAFQWPRSIDESILRPTNAYVAATVESIPLFDVVRGFYKASHQQIPHLAAPIAKHLDELAGLSHVSIITHHVESTHEQVGVLARQLYDRGVGQVSALRGRVYGTALRHEIDIDQLTSKHEAFLHKIGSLCIWEK